MENLFEKQIIDQENEKLQAVPNEEEIYGALKQIPNHKAPGPNGMTTLFYLHYWSIIKKEVMEAVQNFFKSGKLLKQINHTNITLIPKTQNLNTPSHYRPISLTNVIYKIITKIMANCFKATRDTIISLLQTAFAPGHNIKENTIIAHELFHYLKRKTRKKGLMVIKLDMEKTFDLVEW